MYCNNCGTYVEEGQFCHICGAALAADAAQPVISDDTKVPGKGMGTAALLLSLAGIFLSVFCCVPGCYEYLCIPVAVICAIIGFVLAVIAKGKAKEAGKKNGAAQAGLVFSVLTLIIAVLYGIFGAILTSLVAPGIEDVFYMIVS